MESEDDDICPVRLLKSYIDFSLEADIYLSYSYLFRVRDKAKHQVTDRLRTHLRAVNLHDGESSHSSMHGCAITLRMLGVRDDLISNHMCWGGNKMLEHYAGIGDLCGPKSAAK